MVYDYTNIFDELFFNIEKNDDVKEVVLQSSSVLSSLITKFGEVQNELTYGTSQQDDFVDTIIILFIRKIIEQLDAINLLFSAGSSKQAEVILRSLIENAVSLKFILKNDIPLRAAAYCLEHHYQEIELGKECFNKNSKQGKLILDQKGETLFNEDRERFMRKKVAFEKIINSKDIFKEVDELRKKKIQQKKRPNKKNVYIQWYEVCSNVSNFYALMKDVGFEKYYKGIYGGLSFEAHGLNAATGIVVDETGFNLKRLRILEEASSTFALTCTFSISALHDIYKYLQDGEEEKEEFKKFFLEFQDKRDSICMKLDSFKKTD